MAPTHQIVTANRLRDGAVVYLTGDGRWSERLAAGALAEDKAAVADLLAQAERSVADRLVVAPYAFPVALASEGPLPTQKREQIRAAGPTVHPQFGRETGIARAAE